MNSTDVEALVRRVTVHLEPLLLTRRAAGSSNAAPRPAKGNVIEVDAHLRCVTFLTAPLRGD